LGQIDPALLTAAFDVRECCKQLVLLEDHLFQPNKRCPDCIHKHTLCAEALAEEARTLQDADQFPELETLAGEIRSCATAQDVRHVRKRVTGMLRARGLAGGGSVYQPYRSNPSKYTAGLSATMMTDGGVSLNHWDHRGRAVGGMKVVGMGRVATNAGRLGLAGGPEGFGFTPIGPPAGNLGVTNPAAFLLKPPVGAMAQDDGEGGLIFGPDPRTCEERASGMIFAMGFVRDKETGEMISAEDDYIRRCRADRGFPSPPPSPPAYKDRQTTYLNENDMKPASPSGGKLPWVLLAIAAGLMVAPAFKRRR